MRTEEQTSRHLLLAITTTVFSSMLGLITIVMDWEPWMLLLMAGGCFCVWLFHIAKIGLHGCYENFCTGLMLFEFFYFGVHETSLFELPAIACILVLALFMLNKKWILHAIEAIYVLEILYHALILRTIFHHTLLQDIIHLLLNTVIIFGATTLAAYWIKRRSASQEWYNRMLSEMETVGKQNAVFLSNVSHELRTPINMVIGISEVALEKDISPDIREDMTSIKRAGKRLSNQINNMLDYTEIVEGTLLPTKKEYTITSVLNDVITMAALQSNCPHLEIVFDIDPKVPAVLIGDAEKISHVLKILVENSLKFTEEGGINVRIGYREESYGINLIIDIRDTGVGMTDSQMQQMYDDFYQADSGSRRFAGGLGLGLPIARGLLNAMGGFIHFDSKKQQGLQAHIVIPQGVVDKRPCIVLDHPDQVCVACYFRPERYSCDEVRGYYDGLIRSLLLGLGIQGYQTHNFEGLLKLQRSYQLTHVFIAQSEYEDDPAYYEELANTLRVVVIADREFNLENSSLLIMHKPFSALSVANLLNGEQRARNFLEDQSAGRKPFACPGVRALAVDDEEMNLVVAKGVLGSYGMEVDTCLSGKEAVTRCSSTFYDIVFLDHMMPGFDGVQTLKSIRELQSGSYQNKPIVALTANTVSGAREMFRKEGFTEFIPKPIERTVLERVLRRVLPKSLVQYGEDAVKDHTSEALFESIVQYDEETVKDNMPKEQAALVETETLEEVDFAQDAVEELEASQGQLNLPGINVEMGLNYCDDDQEFFLDMLQMFLNQSKVKREEIVSLYDSADWENYAIKVHALKSTSLTIGAEDLSAQAKELELAGKRGDAKFIQAHHSALLCAYDEICEQIAGI